MKIILANILFSSYLFSISGKLIFNDGTTIEGKINAVNMDVVNLVPEGLTFPEDIRIENIDTLKLDDGNILIENSNIVYLYQNGEFLKPSNSSNSVTLYEDDYELEYVLVPNWSVNLYTGHPILGAASFKEYDDWFFLNGFSVGSPYGVFAGDFFMNLIFEFAHYTFKQKNNPDGQSFGGSALQLGISPGFFLGSASISLTACSGAYQTEKQDWKTGFILGGSVDIPIGPFLIDRYGDKEIIESFEEYLESVELRITSRSNLIQKSDGATGWLDAGLSIGYEF
jgi:hypothetical protein